MLSQVTRVQPAFCIQGLLRLLRRIQVAHEDVAAPEADLAISLLVRFVQLRFAPWDFFTTTERQRNICTFCFQLGNVEKSASQNKQTKKTRKSTW